MPEHLHDHVSAERGWFPDLFEVFTPRRQCMNFEPDVIWLHLISDLLIALAYFTIPMALVYFVRRRKDLAFNGIFLLFALFIVLCGTTHLFGVMALWRPMYRLDGVVKFATAIASVGTSALLWRFLPLALSLQSPEQLRLANQRLENEIGEKKRAEDELRRARDELELRVDERTRELLESEASFRQLADSMPQMVWTARPDGYLDYYNKRWYDFTGFPEGRGGDQSWEPILHPEDVVPCREAWYGSVGTGQSYEIKYRFWDRRTGTYRWHLGRALPTEDAEGRVIRWYGTCTDIDDQMKTEAALREADRRKDEFLAMLAHELRNPLTAMRSAVETFDLPGDGDQEWAKQVIGRQVGHLAHLLDDLLDVSRINRGMIRVQKRPVDARSMIDQAVVATRPLIEAKKHRLEVKVPHRPLRLMADPVRLEQILVNLLTNAGKYTLEGGEITLTADLDADQVTFRVRDDGMGMTPEVLSGIFDLFVQAERTLDRSEGGLGIGLTIVKKLVELHDGSVSATSEGAGRGSEFIVRLPAVDVLPDPLTPKARTPVKQGSRILIVDDNKDLANGLARLLRRMGQQVEMAHDGPGGMEAARSHRPDVILLDIGLPILDGYQVARSLRREGFSDTLIIAISGYGQEEDRKRSRDAGFDHHLTKPVDVESIAQLIA